MRAPAAAEHWQVTVPYPLDAELRLLLGTCLTKIERGAAPDLRVHGYSKQPGGFYFKSVQQEPNPATAQDGLIVNSTITLKQNSCRFGVGAMGGQGTELPFMQMVAALLDTQMRQRGFRLHVYEPRPGQRFDIWLKNETGISIAVTGTPGRKIATVAINPALPSILEQIRNGA
ncbi:MAG: hypothetical protein R3D97_06825 [Paracoccaceae bacterium]